MTTAASAGRRLSPMATTGAGMRSQGGFCYAPVMIANARASALAKSGREELLALSLGMPVERHRTKLNRLHSQRIEDAQWRAAQAKIDADIAGLSRSSELARFVCEMKKSGIRVDERINRLKAHVLAGRHGRKPTAP